MRDELVAIDLESTGLDPQTDKIIEVGAVRIRNGKIIDEYETMVNPGISIPQITTQLTGIQQNDVADARKIDQILPEISTFVGDAPVIAHNISLDMGFLQGTHGILKANKSIDTYDLATILLPNAPRYNLNSLTQQVGIELENAHRALDDARATALFYWVMWQKILELPHNLLQEISSLARDIAWDTSIVFTNALRESTTSARDQVNHRTQFSPADITQPAPSSVPTSQPIDLQTVADILGEEGAFAKQSESYEYRPEQISMATAVADAFNTKSHLIVEAGTGAGKSMAYLLPSVLWSTQNNQPVVISTNTINLQDQLLNQEIPTLNRILDLPIKASILKGRSNYLCPHRLATVRYRQPNTTEELKTLAKILVWLLDNESGDKSDISLRGQSEHNTWQRLSAQDENCSLHRCETLMNGTCPFYKARKEAESANILIVNHALLLADANSDNHVLPEYQHVIIDEAHNLENAITHSFDYRINQQTIILRLVDLGTPTRGLFGDLLRNMRDVVPPSDYKKVENFIGTVSEALRLMQTHVVGFFKSVMGFLTDTVKMSSQDNYALVRINQKHRNKTSFAQMQSRWQTLDEFFDVLATSMKRLRKAVRKLKSHNIPNQDNLLSATDSITQYLLETRQHLHQFAVEPDTNTIYWLTAFHNDPSPTIHAAPLHVGQLMEKHLWHEKSTVILTSATLRTQDNFDFIQDRLYADSIDTLEIESSFNYKDSTMVYLPSDMPEPNNRQAYQKAVERGIIELAAAIGGRTMVLFTSYAQLRQTSQAITPRLALGDITVFDQSDGTSREALLEGFKSAEKAVLLGNKSFWEGVDIRGDDLSALVIVRLPFTVPSDPIFSSRSETYNNSFNDYTLPDTILRFRQGFGRLIRSRTDQGVVAVFDARLQTKGYGRHFLEALPDCTIQHGLLDELPKIAKDWLDRDNS